MTVNVLHAAATRVRVLSRLAWYIRMLRSRSTTPKGMLALSAGLHTSPAYLVVVVGRMLVNGVFEVLETFA